MFLFRNFMILIILVSLASAHIDCSGEDTCFGEPIDCDPDFECKTLFHFDSVGNLHLYLRNFSDTRGYAAFAVDKHPDQTSADNKHELFEYLICLPHQGKRLRAIAELGGLAEIVERTLTGVVERIGSNDFRCMFTIFEFPTKFEQEQVFFVSRGIFDDVFVILDGVQLFKLNPSTSDYDEESENDEVFLSTHRVASLSRSGTAEDVFTSDDKESISNAIKKLPEVSETKDDNMLEKLANSRRRLRSRSIRKSRPIHYEDDDRDMEYENEYDMKPLPRSRKSKSRSRQQRDDVDDIDDVEEEEVEEEKEEKRPKKGKKSNGRRRYRGYAEENDDSRKRNSRGKKNKEVDEEDDYEENEKNDDDEIYDDSENSGNKQYNQFHIMVLVALWADMMIFNE